MATARVFAHAAGARRAMLPAELHRLSQQLRRVFVTIEAERDGVDATQSVLSVHVAARPTLTLLRSLVRTSSSIKRQGRGRQAPVHRSGARLVRMIRNGCAKRYVRLTNARWDTTAQCRMKANLTVSINSRRDTDREVSR